MSERLGGSAAAKREGVPGTGLATTLVLLAALSTGLVRAAADPDVAAPNLPEGAGGPWWSEVQRQIRDSEYEITWQERTLLPNLERTWHAPNRAQNLRTYFTGDGVRVVRRTESDPSWELGLELVGYGRGERVLPVGEARLAPHANRVEYRRGPVVEWYLNDREGLKQGFTLNAPPEELKPPGGNEALAAGGRAPGSGDTPAFLVLALGGSVSPTISTDGQAIDFRAPGSVKVLHYAELAVTDAGGRRLPSWMEGFAEGGVRGIRIVFEDQGARYPVSVDPLLTSAAWTVDGGQAEAEFGYSVSTAGDVNGDGYADVIVGAHRYDNGDSGEGRAFAYHGSGSGLASVHAWTAESNQWGADFGFSVSTAGDVNGDGYSDVIVGAPYYQFIGYAEGRAYVYHGSATGLSATLGWRAEGGQEDARFGHTVSTAGDVNGDGYSDVIVGAFTYSNGEYWEGGAFAYHGSAAGVNASPAWTAESDEASANFGCSVSTAGDVNGDGYSDVIVGSWYYGSSPNGGGAFVYHGSTAGLGPASAWTVTGDQSGARFGYAVSGAGDVNGDGYADVIVGALDYTNGETEEGRAYLYHGSTEGLATTAAWTAEGEQAEAHYGQSVSRAGDVNGDGYADVLVGVPSYGNDETYEGRAYLYRGSSSGLGASPVWTLEGDQTGAFLGVSVSTAGDVNGDGYADVIVGAPFHDNGGGNEGRALAYHGSAEGLDLAAGWTDEGIQANSTFGISLSTAGDVNGDGFADVIIGAERYDSGAFLNGRALLYRGSAWGLGSSPVWVADGDQGGARFGHSVSTAGDVNGDGYDEVVIGSPLYDNGHIDEGRVFVYQGSPIGLGGLPAWTIEINREAAELGASVSTAGDVNGDGFGDIILGAPRYNWYPPAPDAGRAFVYQGSPEGLNLRWGENGDQADSLFAFSVSTAGDVNGDGYDDVLVGAPEYDNGENLEGRAYLYQGSATGLSGTPDWVAESDQSVAFFGTSVSTAGDVNGDGYADVVVGAPNYDNDFAEDGGAFVYLGSAAGPSTTPDWVAVGGQPAAFLGFSVSTAGDVNGDGYADLVVGAHGYLVGDLSVGRAFVYHGSAAGLSTTPDWTAESDQEYSFFGRAVSTAGDVNGDGCADVVVGAPLYDDGLTRGGQAYLYYGGGGRGLSLAPRQWQPLADTPIARRGRSEATDGFRLRLHGRSPWGGGRARLEWEVKPLGTLLDGEGTSTGGSWEELAGGAALLEESVTGLAAETPYHWRLRLLYEGASTPYQQYSRWVTLPQGGWNETDLRTLDADGDGYPSAVDCDNADPSVWSVPGKLLSLEVSPDDRTFSWDPPNPPGGTPESLRYDLLRSPLADDFGAPASCLATDIVTREMIDEDVPATGGLLAYLVRSENSCGGNLGRHSTGAQREGRSCP